MDTKMLATGNARGDTLMKIAIPSIALAIVLCFGFSGNAVADLSDELAAYYPFNGNADDESGNGNHGTTYGAALTNDRFGNSNSAYEFDGVDDYIGVLDDDTFDLGGLRR